MWETLIVDDRIIASWNLPLVQWCKQNILDLKDIIVGDWNWPSLFANVSWLIWKWRNIWVFEKKEVPVLNKLEVIARSMREWRDVWGEFNHIKNKITVELAWDKPAVNWIKLNTDGSWDQEKGKAAAGGLFRDSNGTWLGGFSYHIGDCSIDLAEMWGLYHGIKYARQLNLNYLEIEFDSKNSVLAVEKGVGENHPLYPLTQAIKEMQDNSWNWSLNHVPREKNRATDWLAKWSCSQTRGITYLSRPPSGLSSCLLADMMRLSHSRMITL